MRNDLFILTRVTILGLRQPSIHTAGGSWPAWLLWVVIIPFLVLSCASEARTLPPTASPSPTPDPLAFNADAFPLAKGAYWISEGGVQWQEGTEIREDHLTWKMEVIEVIERGRVAGYLLRGHPVDLAWYEPGKTPGEHVIIRIDSNYYNSDRTAWERLKDEEDYLVDLVTEGQLFLELPLWPGKFYGETGQMARPDTFYRWLVEAKSLVKFEGIKGVSTVAEWPQYTTAFRTLPDHQVIEFVPKLGITRYIYGHHGTVANVDVTLVAYQPGLR